MGPGRAAPAAAWSLFFERADLFLVRKLGTGKLVLIEDQTFLAASLLLRSQKEDESSSW